MVTDVQPASRPSRRAALNAQLQLVPLTDGDWSVAKCDDRDGLKPPRSPA